MGMIKRIKKRRAKRKAWDSEHKETINKLEGQTDVAKQYIGGSKLGSNVLLGRYEKSASKGTKEAYASVDAARAAAERASDDNAYLRQDFRNLASENRQNALNMNAKGNEAWQGYSTDRSNFQAGREGILTNAAALERSAQNMVSDFQKTDAARFAADAEAAQRQALSAARSSGAGALGIRAALGMQSAAQAQALQNAGITRANETNALLGMQNDAYANAAGIRTGLSAQDIASANLAANTAQGMYGLGQNALSAAASSTGAAAGLTQADANNAMAAAQLGAQVGSAQSNLNTQAGLSARTSQLGASTAAEIARAESAMNQLLNEKAQKNPHKIGGKVISAIFDPGNIRGAADGEWIGSTTV